MWEFEVLEFPLNRFSIDEFLIGLSNVNNLALLIV